MTEASVTKRKEDEFIPYSYGQLFTLMPITVKGKDVDMLVNTNDLHIPPREELQKIIDDAVFVRDNMSDDEIKLFNLERDAEIDKEFEELYARDEEERRKSKSRGPVPELGYVYLIKEEFSGTYKIGLTKNIERRSEQFDVKLPFDWNFVYILRTSDHKGLEKVLHKVFADKRVNGEWFSLTPDDVAFIGSLNKNESYARYEIGVTEFDAGKESN